MIGPQTEAQVQEDCKRLVMATGGSVLCDSSQGYRPGGKRHGSTRITVGFPDLMIGYPTKGDRSAFVAMVEVKGPDGKVSPQQVAWHVSARACGLAVWVVHSVHELAAFLETRNVQITT